MKLSGPIVLWSRVEPDSGNGYIPENHPDVRSALAHLKGGDFFLTNGEIEIGVVKTRKPAAAGGKKKAAAPA